MGWRRQVARLIEHVSGNHVVPHGALHLLHETLHLRRLFSVLEIDCVFDVGANRGQYARLLEMDCIMIRADLADALSPWTGA